jgi:SRSO17 transposase
MRKQPHDTTAATATVAPPDHLALLEEAKATIAGLFGRREPRATFWDLVIGLLMGLPTANCWTIAEAVGHSSPYRLQHLLSRAVWDADAVLARIACWVIAHLSGPAILVVDETGDAKSSTDAVGAARQYSGSLGGVGVCQVAVHLSLATPVGHAVIGRRLYLGADWASDDERRTLTGVPDDVAFATKPDLAISLLREAAAAGVRAQYVVADEVYSSRAFRTACRELGLGYVAAMPANRQVTTGDHRPRPCTEAVRLVPAGAWHRMRTGTATKGAKDYDWALITIEPDDTPSGAQADGQDWPIGHSVLLARRHRYTRKISYFRCWTPTPVSLADLVFVVCARWHVEEDFQLSKRSVGLDQGQVRTWTSWHRWSTASLTAYAILVVATLLEHATSTDDPTDLVPISCPELQHLLAATLLPPPPRDPDQVHRWSRWRRGHQAVARRCHRAWNAYADRVA